jgi:hypothetical protein
VKFHSATKFKFPGQFVQGLPGLGQLRHHFGIGTPGGQTVKVI